MTEFSERLKGFEDRLAQQVNSILHSLKESHEAATRYTEMLYDRSESLGFPYLGEQVPAVSSGAKSKKAVIEQEAHITSCRLEDFQVDIVTATMHVLPQIRDRELEVLDRHWNMLHKWSARLCEIETERAKQDD